MLLLVDAVVQAHQAAAPALAACATVPNPAPSDAGLPGAAEFNTILGWVRWSALVATVAAVLISGGVLAWGHFSTHQHAAMMGRSALIWSGIGAIIVGLGPVLIQGMFNLGSGASC